MLERMERVQFWLGKSFFLRLLRIAAMNGGNCLVQSLMMGAFFVASSREYAHAKPITPKTKPIFCCYHGLLLCVEHVVRSADDPDWAIIRDCQGDFLAGEGSVGSENGGSNSCWERWCVR